MNTAQIILLAICAVASLATIAGLVCTLIKKSRIEAVVSNYVTKWQAIGIALAPFTDLTIVAILIIALINSWPVTVGILTFLTINLMLSAKDIVTGFLIYRYYIKNSRLFKTIRKFELGFREICAFIGLFFAVVLIVVNFSILFNF